MKIQILAIGKCKDKAILSVYNAYLKRLKPYAQITLHELSQGKGGSIKQEEAHALFSRISKGSYVVALDERGNLWDTLRCAAFLQARQMDGPNVTFIIGGADGLDESVRTKADTVWSLSPLTFPHMLVRVMLCEQLYRACSLNAGHPYHRG